MAKFLDYSNPTTIGQVDAAIRTAKADGVCHYMSGSFARRLEQIDIVTGIRGIGWPQIGIDVPTLRTCNGVSAARRAFQVYGHRGLFALDIEPSEFVSDPRGWAAAANEWCLAVESFPGLIPGIYGVDATLAVCSDDAKWIWRAKPGMCDPSGPGLASGFFPNRRAVQCSEDKFAGLVCDVSFSNFPIGLPPISIPPTVVVTEDSMPVIATRVDGTRDMFVVAAGIMRHIVIDTSHKVLFNDPLEGAWICPLDAWWSADDTLTASGLGIDGHVWSVKWTAGVWSATFDEV